MTSYNEGMSNSPQKQFVDSQVAAFRATDTSENGLITKHKIVLEMILNNSKKTDRVLDVGCSEGKILKDLIERGYSKLYGIDIQEWSKTALAGTKVNYAECDIERETLPFKGPFDVIIISDVLEHLFSPQSVLYDLKKHLSPHGKIFFSMPNAGWFLNGILLTFFPNKLFVSTAFGPWGHTHQFTFFEVREIARQLKYKIHTLKGGRLDNYAFKKGLKKYSFDLFVYLTAPLTIWLPTIFSAHIFGILENTKKNPLASARFDLGV